MNLKMTRFLSLVISLAGVQACGPNNGKVDLGASVTGASLADYVDQWEGYTEARQFVPGSDRIRVKIGADGQGTLVLGDAHTYPVPTDPNLGYPPEDDAMSVTGKAQMFQPGMEYPLHGVKVESKRIRFTVSMNDFYKAWCELQTPIPTSTPGYYSCGPDGFSSDGNGMCFAGTSTVPVNCAKALLCSQFVCTCTATSCTSYDDFYVQFDAALGEEGAQLVGTFNGATVRLDRQ
jgi:hypothetical protein